MAKLLGVLLAILCLVAFLGAVMALTMLEEASRGSRDGAEDVVLLTVGVGALLGLMILWSIGSYRLFNKPFAIHDTLTLTCLVSAIFCTGFFTFGALMGGGNLIMSASLVILFMFLCTCVVWTGRKFTKTS